MGELQDGIYHGPSDRPGAFFAIAFFRAAHALDADAVGKRLGELWSMWQDRR